MSDNEVPVLTPIGSETVTKPVKQSAVNNFQDMLVFLLDKIDKMKASVANVTTASLFLQEELSAREQDDRIFFHPSTSDYPGEFAGGEFQLSVAELDPSNQEYSMTKSQGEESVETPTLRQKFCLLKRCL